MGKDYTEVSASVSGSIAKCKAPMFIVCTSDVGYGTGYYTADTIEEAQTKAEEFAHKSSSDVFILKAVRKVAPKRDVVTTEL